MLFAPYRSVLDLANDVNHSAPARQLTWDEIDFELGGPRPGAIRIILGRFLTAVTAPTRSRRTSENAGSKSVSLLTLDRAPRA